MFISAGKDLIGKTLLSINRLTKFPSSFFWCRSHERTQEELELVFEELLHIPALSHLSTSIKRELASIIVFESHPHSGTVCELNFRLHEKFTTWDSSRIDVDLFAAIMRNSITSSVQRSNFSLCFFLDHLIHNLFPSRP